MEVGDEQREMTTNKVMCLLTLDFVKTLGFKSFNRWSIKLLNNVSFCIWVLVFIVGGLFGC